MVVACSEGRIIYFNQAARYIFGYNDQELVDPNLVDLIPEFETEFYSGNLSECISHALIEDVLGRRKSGDTVHINIKLSTWTDTQHGVMHALALRDITKDIAEDRQKKQEFERISHAVQSVRVGIFEYDVVTDEIFMSDIASELLELDNVEPSRLNEEWHARVHPDDLSATMAFVEFRDENPTEQINAEYRIRSRDDTHWKWIKASVTVFSRDEDLRPIRLVGSITDISERKAADQTLNVSVEQFRSIFESAPIGKAIVSLEGKLVLCNDALASLLGYTKDQLSEVAFQAMIYPEDLDEELIKFELLTSGQVPSYQMEKRFIRADGAVVWGLLNVSLVQTSGDQPRQLIAQIVDITEQKQLSEMKSEFVATVSHELRTPLTSVLGSLALLSSIDSETLPESVSRLIRIGHENGNRLKTLVDDILNFEKFAARNTAFCPANHKVLNLVEIGVSKSLAGMAKFNVRTNTVKPDRSLVAFVDPEKFYQVMQHLLSNAAKFSEANGHVDVAIEQEKDFIRISITNKGVGIAEEFRKSVFLPFTQEAPSTTRSREGSGLGLSLAKQIVEQSGGKIGYDSVQGGVTTFWFTVPTVKPSGIENG